MFQMFITGNVFYGFAFSNLFHLFRLFSNFSFFLTASPCKPPFVFVWIVLLLSSSHSPFFPSFLFFTFLCSSFFLFLLSNLSSPPLLIFCHLSNLLSSRYHVLNCPSFVFLISFSSPHPQLHNLSSHSPNFLHMFHLFFTATNVFP